MEVSINSMMAAVMQVIITINFAKPLEVAME
jgi:hypothetical protein